MTRLDRTLIGLLTGGVWSLFLLQSPCAHPATAEENRTAAEDEKTRAICEDVLSEALETTTDARGLPMAGRIGQYIEEKCTITNGDDDKNIKVHCGTWHGDYTQGKWVDEKTLQEELKKAFRRDS